MNGKTMKKQVFGLMIAAGALVMSGCLQSAPRYRTYNMDPRVHMEGTQVPQNPGSAVNSSGIRPDGTDGTTGGTSTIPVPEPSATPEPVGTDPLITKSFERLGGSSKYVTYVRAARLLKIRFQPGEQTKPPSGYPDDDLPTYAHLGVYIKVGDSERPTGMLSSGMQYDAETSDVLDFSHAFDRDCELTDEDCRQWVKITVYRPNYDYYCLHHPQSSRCYMTPGYSRVYDLHYWNGKIQIRTDDTVEFSTPTID